MLDAGEVVGKARDYLEIIMPSFLEMKPQVEEMVLSENGAMWKITFKAQLQPKAKPESLADVIRAQTLEKVVEIAAQDGSLIAVRNPEYSF